MHAGLTMRFTDTCQRNAPRERVDWNSLFLILLLALPAAAIWIMLTLWPGFTRVAAVPYTAIELLGSFVMLLLAVFIIARYKTEAGTLYVGAGLTGMAVLEGFLIAAAPQASQDAWLHTLSGIYGAGFFLMAALARFVPPLAQPGVTLRGAAAVMGLCALIAGASGAVVIALPDVLPAMVDADGFTAIAWWLNAVPLALFLFSGASLFYDYRRHGSQAVLLFTAIVIFLFQASEVFYFADTWSLVWWFWQGLRLAVYISVLGYVMAEHIRTSASLVTEIAERQRAEIALRAAEEDWRRSFNSLDDVMLIVARDYRIVRINDSGLSLLGMSAGEVTGKRCYDVFHDGVRPGGSQCPCRRSFRTGKAVLTQGHQSLHGRCYSVKSAPILTGPSRPQKCVCLMQDVTREVRAREKEKELQRELNMASRLASIGEVAAGIAHEINNPLTGVIGFAEMLSEMDVPGPMREAVDVIHDGARRTAGIVQKLLTFARHNRSNKEMVDLNAVLLSTLEIRAYPLRTGGIELRTELDSALPRTLANFGQLQQVFLNLIINAEQAIEASGRPGRISVSSESRRSRLRVTISDTGVGISTEDLGKLFDPFFTTRSDSGGTGLGLSISYGIIKEHGGSIRVHSAPGQGATFRVELPVKAGLPVARLQPESGAAPGKSGQILVVDDEVSIRSVLDRVLTREGHHVDTAATAEEALERLRSRTYDLVLMDIRMPGMSGIDLFHRVSEAQPDFRRKVVFITGDIISPRNKAFIEDNGVDYVAKPFTGETLLRQVNMVLGGKTHAEAEDPDR